MDIITYKPKGVCSKEINIAIQDGVITAVSFKSGCNGNLSAISKLVEGMTVESVIGKLNGIKCGKKETSCPDQLSIALQEYLNSRGFFDKN